MFGPLLQVSAGKILENEIPVFVVTFATQEMLLFRNAKTREIIVGSEDRVEQCHYAAVITRVQEELDDELTGGWKVVEVRSILYIWYSPAELTSCADGSTISSRIPLAPHTPTSETHDTPTKPAHRPPTHHSATVHIIISSAALLTRIVFVMTLDWPRHGAPFA